MRTLLASCLLLFGVACAQAGQCEDGSTITRRGLSSADIKAALDVHNRFRDDVAAGKVRAKDGTLPSAKNMMKLVWDDNLAAAAQAHADKCEYEHSQPEPEKYGTSYGQNLFISMSTGNLGPADWDYAVQDWFDEKKDFPKAGVEPYRSQKGVGHFTQVIWGETARLGCGYTEYVREDEEYPQQALYTCNYAPTGNMRIMGADNPIYQKGAPCSSCKCDGTFKHLCT